jgi:rSAM/selenodomain-associated transferase 2
VADGGSSDGTAELAAARGCTVVCSPPGRGRQLRAGVAASRGEWLLVLHADVRLSAAALSEAEAALSQPALGLPPFRAASWPLAIDGDGSWFRWVERGAALRWRLFGLAYGDQGLLVTRSLYDAAGGYPDTRIMEDAALIRRIGRLAVVRHFQRPILADPRRWRREGRVRATLRNWALLALFLAGVEPERLARWYLPEPRPQ